MNILFYTNLYPDYLLGGIERITSRLATALRNKGYGVFSLYVNEYKSGKSYHLFDDELYIPQTDVLSQKTEICSFIEKNKIDVVVVQSIWENKELLYAIRKACKCKIIYAYHSLPCFEYDWVTYKKDVFPLLKNMFHDVKSLKEFVENVRNIKRAIIYANNWNEIINDTYRYLYNNSDWFVLLSASFIDIMRKNVHLGNKLTAIPNMLSYDEFLPMEKLHEKEKIVLVVTRMQERQKKISRVLKLWEKIEKDSTLSDWRLEIVGDGPDLSEYKDYASKKLHRVTFFGQQTPIEYYKRASVFLMTSAYEGFGITLTEAQQFGCVPVVLNTFSAAKDIIANGRNGFLADNMTVYYKRLRKLLADSNLRLHLASNAIESSKKFCPENVTGMWEDLFKLATTY